MRRPRIPTGVQLVFGVVILATSWPCQRWEALCWPATCYRWCPGDPALCFYDMASRPALALVDCVTCAAFVFALLTPPPYRIAPEDTLLYRDYIIAPQTGGR